MALVQPKGRFAEIDLLAIRISRRAANGAPVVGTDSALVFACDAARLEITPNVEQGTNVQAESGCSGRSANSWTVPDKILGWNGVLRMSNVSDELLEILSIGDQVRKAVTADETIVGTVFYESDACSVAATDNGVIFEAWSRPVLCGSQRTISTALAWRHLVAPFAKGFVIAEAYQPGPEFFPYVFNFKLSAGTGNLGDGPFNDLDDLDPATNLTAPAVTYAWASFWDTATPPTATDPNTYIAVAA